MSLEIFTYRFCLGMPKPEASFYILNSINHANWTRIEKGKAQLTKTQLNDLTQAIKFKYFILNYFNNLTWGKTEVFYLPVFKNPRFFNESFGFKNNALFFAFNQAMKDLAYLSDNVFIDFINQKPQKKQIDKTVDIFDLDYSNLIVRGFARPNKLLETRLFFNFSYFDCFNFFEIESEEKYKKQENELYIKSLDDEKTSAFYKIRLDTINDYFVDVEESEDLAIKKISDITDINRFSLNKLLFFDSKYGDLDIYPPDFLEKNKNLFFKIYQAAVRIKSEKEAEKL